MKTTARQFFDIWCECTTGLSMTRQFASSRDAYKQDVIERIQERHGPQIAIEAECYFERLRADTQAGISSL